MKRTLLGLTALLASQVVHAFTFVTTDSTLQGWAQRPLQFHLNPSNCPANIRTLIGNAMTLWNSVSTSSLKLELGSDSTNDGASIINGTATDVPLIVCATDFASVISGDADSIAGVGTIGLEHNPITSGGLILNLQPDGSANISNFSEALATSVIAHEMGHVLGLGHSADSAALMYYDASAKETLSLAQDDIDGIDYLYPRNELKHFNMIGGCGSLRSMGDESPWGGNSLLLLATLYLVVRVLRRVRSAHSAHSFFKTF